MEALHPQATPPAHHHNAGVAKSRIIEIIYSILYCFSSMGRSDNDALDEERGKQQGQQEQAALC